MTPDQIIAKLKELRVPHDRIAEVLGRNRVQATKMLNDRRQIKAGEVPGLLRLIKQYEAPNAGRLAEDRMRFEYDERVNETIHYLPVDILPTYAGMGGGGTGEGEVERALIPRYLIEDVFRGKPDDFVVIRTRGDSMEPDFQHDDELLVDKRDTSPTQPGPFALWDAEWSEYVVKNVERLPQGKVRIFSSNGKYTPVEVMHEETSILGRPVWVGRRL